MSWLLTALLCLSTGALAEEAKSLHVLPAQIDGTSPGQMMHRYLMQRVRTALDRRRAAYEELKTAEQVGEYSRRLRELFVERLGGFPARTPLHAQTVGTQQRDGYRVEKVIFESQPQLYVTSVLYLPQGTPPFPGVLFPCGHSSNGKASEYYQRGCILLARNGMAVLCYDPIDQGERYQLLDAAGKPVVGGTTAHCLVGVGSTLLGRNTATFRIFDGMRAIDYLQSRAEVDPERIGCTGNSGGGTLTSYLMALDQRIDCAAPSCHLTTLRRLCETIGPQDAEQNIFGQIEAGLDHPDYLIMRAPKPTLMCTATRDYFDIDGAWDCFRQAKRVYGRLGFPERVDLVETDGPHGFSMPLRVAATRWMRRWLLHVDDAVSEPDLEIASDQQMWCTPQGQVMRLPGARTTYDINIAEEQRLAESRKRFWRETERAQALQQVRRLTGIRPLAELPELKCQQIATVDHEDYRLEKLILEPEPGIWLPALCLVPGQRSREAYLYLHASGKQTDLGVGGPIEKLRAAGHLVLAVDLRGLGETAGGDAAQRGIAHYMGPQWKDVYLAYLLGTSYLAMRAEDILQCARFLADYHCAGSPNQVHLVSIGRTGPPALHAAALEPELFASVTLKRCLASWSMVVRTPLATNQLENVVHGALKCYDLPDLQRTLPPEKLSIVEPVGAAQKPLGSR